MEVYWRENSSLEMKSFMLLPAGGDKCMIILHLSFFLGTTPTPEQHKFVKDREQNGPSMRPITHSLANSVSTMWGCC